MTDQDDVTVELMLIKVSGDVQVMRSQIRELQGRAEKAEYMAGIMRENIV